MKLDILAFGAHPDDVELGCGGTLIQHIKKGMKVGIVDITLGEAGTRGTPEIRLEEAKNAAKIIGAEVRENCRLPDATFENNFSSQEKVIKLIRKYQPSIVIAPAIFDRHPDHGRAAGLVEEACFLSGLIKIETQLNDDTQKPWRPQIVLHYLQDRFIIPNIVIDVTGVWDKKMESLQAHKSQFYSEDSNEPDTYISSKNFFDNITSRAMEVGRPCGFRYAEAFTCNRYIGIKDLTQIV